LFGGQAPPGYAVGAYSVFPDALTKFRENDRKEVKKGKEIEGKGVAMVCLLPLI